jgi:threonine/homoserine/homoserine lactone efflux protein
MYVVRGGQVLDRSRGVGSVFVLGLCCGDVLWVVGCVFELDLHIVRSGQVLERDRSTVGFSLFILFGWNVLGRNCC